MVKVSHALNHSATAAVNQAFKYRGAWLVLTKQQTGEFHEVGHRCYVEALDFTENVLRPKVRILNS